MHHFKISSGRIWLGVPYTVKPFIGVGEEEEEEEEEERREYRNDLRGDCNSNF